MSDFFDWDSDYYARGQVAELRKNYELHLKIQRQSRAHNYKVEQHSSERLLVLEHNFSRLLLLVEGLLHEGRQHGWLNEANLLKTCAAIDAHDGMTDGKLDPEMVPGMKPKPKDPSQFSIFKGLEDAPVPQPLQDAKEFLKSLEQKS